MSEPLDLKPIEARMAALSRGELRGSQVEDIAWMDTRALLTEVRRLREELAAEWHNVSIIVGPSSEVVRGYFRAEKSAR